MKYTVTVKLREDFVRKEGAGYVVGIRATPEKGKANAEVIRKLARHLKVPQKSIRIVSGHTTRRKIIEVDS